MIFTFYLPMTRLLCQVHVKTLSFFFQSRTIVAFTYYELELEKYEEWAHVSDFPKFIF